MVSIFVVMPQVSFTVIQMLYLVFVIVAVSFMCMLHEIQETLLIPRVPFLLVSIDKLLLMFYFSFVTPQCGAVG